MNGFRLSPNTRRFLLWTARLAFLAYFVQIMAIDHWHSHPVDVFGVEGTSAHVAHCHGAGDCSDGGAIPSPTAAAPATLPVPPASLATIAAETQTVPAAALIDTPLQPPRAA
ncbi:MAG TPA: hypothetical protein VIB47_06055 [Dehalococcoidia bacterium]|jgi:hypothetical protein